MSMTLKCDTPGCGATGDNMHGIEMIYGFGSPDVKLGGHFCNECWRRNMSKAFEAFKKHCRNLTPRPDDQPQQESPRNPGNLASMLRRQ